MDRYEIWAQVLGPVADAEKALVALGSVLGRAIGLQNEACTRHAETHVKEIGADASKHVSTPSMGYQSERG